MPRIGEPHKVAGGAAAIVALLISFGLYVLSVAKGAPLISWEGFWTFAVSVIVLFVLFMYPFIGIAHLGRWLAEKWASIWHSSGETNKGRD